MAYRLPKFFSPDTCDKFERQFRFRTAPTGHRTTRSQTFPKPTPATAAPEASGVPSRIIVIDALRGIAVMGILLMNIVGFALPNGAYHDPTVYGGATGADLASWLAAFVLVDGKMRGLFSVLFGASMIIIMTAAQAETGKGTEVHIRRMLILLLFGCIHLYLIWEGDILVIYAIFGFLLTPLANLTVRRMLQIAACLLFLDLAINGIFASLPLLFSNPALSAAANAKDAALDLAIYRGPYWTIVEQRLAELPLIPLLRILIDSVETPVYMLLGMAAYKAGLFHGRISKRTLRRIAILCLAAGASIGVICGLFLIETGFAPDILPLISYWAVIPAQYVMTLGYLLGFLLLLSRPSAVQTRIAAAGQAAFTNYLGTSILMTFIFYGYGAGLYGELSRWELYPVAFAVCGIMLLWSKPWLQRFEYGPFEWLWRSMARARWQPFRRQQ